MWEARIQYQYDQELADLWYESDGLHFHLFTSNSPSDGSHESICVARERLEACRRSSMSLHLRLELDLSSGFGEFPMGFAQFHRETVGSHLTLIVKLVSLVSNVSQPDSRSIIELPHSAERSDTVPRPVPTL